MRPSLQMRVRTGVLECLVKDCLASYRRFSEHQQERQQ
jgi:hypothetical protein